MSDTPRTDSEEESVNMTASENEWRVSDGGWVSSDFARQLERELSAANSQLGVLLSKADELRAELERLKKELATRP